MADLSTDDRIKLAVEFISQAPPGEVNDVITDIATIIGDNDALTPHVAAALREYNLSNMCVVEHGGDEPSVSLLSASHRLDNERYVDFDKKRSYAFDHVRLIPSDYQEYILPEADEAFRAELAASLMAYAKNHYMEGCASVSTNQNPVDITAGLGNQNPVDINAGLGSLSLKDTAGSTDAPSAPTNGVGITPEVGGVEEQAATPAEGDVVRNSSNEVDAPGGMAQLDQEMEAEAEAEAAAGEAGGAAQPGFSAVDTETPDAQTDDRAAPTTVGIVTPAVEDGGREEQMPSPEIAKRVVVAEHEVDAPGGIEKLDEEVEGVAHHAHHAAPTTVGIVIPAVEDGGRGERMPSPEIEKRVVGADHEVDAPGGIEKLDEEVEEVAHQSEESQDVEEEQKRAVAALEEEKADDAEHPAAKPAAAAEALPNPVFTLEIVGNRFKPQNFWTGRWRTKWVVDAEAGSVVGEINLDVHYYEQGNVQLKTHHTASFPIPAETNGQSVASQIVTSIAKIETNYQLEMNDVYEHMGGSAFRSLRRALPVTRQKIDWDKVQGYALGSDLTRARA